jgi:hypothetical protein
MMQMMKRRLTECCVALALGFACAAPAMAQDEEERPDARVEGYALADDKVGPVLIDPKTARTNATVWFMLAGMGVVGLGVMFKNAKRTHLD